MNEMETMTKNDPYSVMIETTRKKLNGRYARIQTLCKMTLKSDHDKALLAVLQVLAGMPEDEICLFVKQFKGLCNKCGKWDHKGVDSRTNGTKGTESTDLAPGA